MENLSECYRIRSFFASILGLLVTAHLSARIIKRKIADLDFI